MIISTVFQYYSSRADSPPVPSVDEELRQLEGKLSARCAQCGAAVLLCPHLPTARRYGTGCACCVAAQRLAERGGGRAARVARLSAKALYKSNRAARPHYVRTSPRSVAV